MLLFYTIKKKRFERGINVENEFSEELKRKTIIKNFLRDLRITLKIKNEIEMILSDNYIQECQNIKNLLNGSLDIIKELIKALDDYLTKPEIKNVNIKDYLPYFAELLDPDYHEDDYHFFVSK